jgi:predicted transposase YbfD/YdcC
VTARPRDVKTSRRSHDRATGTGALHLVSAATTQRLVLGQEAVPAKANELTAIPVLIGKLSENHGLANRGLAGTLVSIDAIATNATIAQTILEAGADYLLAVKANQSTIRAEIERYFNDAPADRLETHADIDKAMAASKNAGSPFRPKSTGWMAHAASRAKPGCPEPRRSFVSPPEANCVTIHASRHAISSPRAASTPGKPQKQSAPTGRSRTRSTGHSMSSSTKINPASGRDKELPTWLSSGTWPSISCAKAKGTHPSNENENKPHGNRNCSSRSSTNHSVNLDSEPWAQPAQTCVDHRIAQ